MKAILIGSREGFRGVLETEQIYEDILLENTDFTPEQKNKITHYTIPATVFERLLKLDRERLINIDYIRNRVDNDKNKELKEQLIADITKSDMIHSIKCDGCKDPNGSSSYCASCACATLANNLIEFGWRKENNNDQN